MNTVTIDYLNMQFMVYQDGQLQDNPLPVEVQRVVIKKIIKDLADHFRRQLRHQMTDEPPSLKAHLIH